MGYDVHASMIGVKIPAAKVAGAIKALRELMGRVKCKGGGGTYQDGHIDFCTFSWVDTDTVMECLEVEDLAGALGEWRYSCSTSEPADLQKLAFPERAQHGEVVFDYFDGQKWGDDDSLWSALAPFIAEGGEIEWRGEDDALWKYAFDGGRLTELAGRTVWEER